ncbi:SEC-C metal-binding domain-containing protein [uncultured Paenibacillus sp.]|uniref:SEC-C metal-binding domain-containing protein n=1 Tax=uncultured Paenibacillus sp. TaxID=227322 RepID=UPI0037DDC3F0
MNPGRNDLCPCGSGKKYKKCCIPLYDKPGVSAAVSMHIGGESGRIVCSVQRGGFLDAGAVEPVVR